MSKNQPPKFFGVNSPYISDDKKNSISPSGKNHGLPQSRGCGTKAGLRFACRDKIESNLQSQMYKNRLLIRGVPRLAGHQVNERRGPRQIDFLDFFDFKSTGSPFGQRWPKCSGETEFKFSCSKERERRPQSPQHQDRRHGCLNWKSVPRRRPSQENLLFARRPSL
jgi:hypothetical protein